MFVTRFFAALIAFSFMAVSALPSQAFSKSTVKLVQFLGASEFAGSVQNVKDDENLDGLDLTGVSVDEFFCWKMDMVDPRTKKVIGKGIDCLDFQTPGADVPGNIPGNEMDASGKVTAATATVDVFTVFIFDDGGTIVNRGTTTIQPFVPGFGDAGFGNRFVPDTIPNLPVTHLTGSIPNPGDDSFVLTTGDFSHVSGNARVSGAVSLADTKSGNPVFDCLWELNLTTNRRKRRSFFRR